MLSNLGCEAIFRGTVKILRASLGAETQFRLPCFDIKKDRERLSDVEGVELIAIPRARILAQNALRLLDLPPAIYLFFYPFRYRLSALWGRDCTAVLAVGGDSYATPTGRLHWDLLRLQRSCLSNAIPFFVWGANFEPFRTNVAKVAFRHLQECTAVFVRDGISEKYLEAHGIMENVKRVYDPAFVMDSQPWDIERFLPKRHTQIRVGITLSPLVEKLFPQIEIASVLSRAVERFIDATGQSVVLVSHVFSPNPTGDDSVFCRRVYQKIKSKYRPFIGLADEDVGAPKMKYLISQMDAYAGARMHGTIAAYSSSVPTIALAYSQKAQALNTMLFDHNRWQLDISQITADLLFRKLTEILDCRDAVRSELAKRISSVKEEANNAGIYLSEYLNHHKKLKSVGGMEMFTDKNTFPPR